MYFLEANLFYNLNRGIKIYWHTYTFEAINNSEDITDNRK